ncbi:MAG: sigma-70 family RNA polymerase sigma factor [Planctomycetota bacterium]|nr:sigma-70 family RNA polymerase sigma factor [Planctomycetota bacterium]
MNTGQERSIPGSDAWGAVSRSPTPGNWSGASSLAGSAGGSAGDSASGSAGGSAGGSVGGGEQRVSASGEPTLLQRIAAGDKVAVRECIDRYGGLIWSLARRLAASDSDAEDTVQEIFVELWRHAGRFDPNVASETAFIAMIARRRLIDRRRKRDRQIDRQPLGEMDVGGVRPPEGRAEVGEEAVRAAGALRQLSADQQRVLTLSIYQGLSHEKIARTIDMPLGTVKTHARRGLIRIRELLGVTRASPGNAGEGLGIAEAGK